MQTKKLMRPEEAADFLGLKLSTVRRMILLRRVPVIKIGRSVRLPIEALEEIVRKGWREAVVGR